MAYVLTGGTGFIGRHLLGLLSQDGEEVHVLVRPRSRDRLTALRAALPRSAARRVHALEGDITRPEMGVDTQALSALSGAEVFHLAAVYDMEADEEANRLANVEGTRQTVAFANRIGAARLHHTSSIVVAGGRFKGEFREDMFDEGQDLDHPYFRTKFEAERIVREESRVPYRVYRPGIVVGSSQTGDADRVDGPYYGFKLIQRLRDSLPAWFPLLGYEGGPFYMVPVDFVAAAMHHIARQPGLDGKTFHIVEPRPLSFGDTVNELCRAAHAPQFTLRLDRRATSVLPRDLRSGLSRWPVAQTLRRQLLQGIRVPPAVLAYVANRARFSSENTQAALQGSGLACPPLRSYAWKIWDYWERHLDPEALTPRNLRAVLEGQVVVVTGASSGIGRATALEVGRHGARVVLVSRSRDKLEQLAAEITEGGGSADVHPTDLSDLDACQRMIEAVLLEHGRVDILVNNAGRSIRRSFLQSLDRFHDFQRTMQLNYFGAVKLMMAVLPGMRERNRGHVINISSIGVQACPPRFGAYVASKSALAALSRCVAPEVADEGISITNIHMPLVRTPMIAPTGMYEHFPTISAEEAAEMVLTAILTRPPEVSTRLGKLGEAVDTLSPGLLHLVMTGAYHAFPESAPRTEGARSQDDGEISVEAAALAYLMRGIHF